jgi:hypothetical protein
VMETTSTSGSAHPVWGAHFLFELCEDDDDDVLIVVRDNGKQVLDIYVYMRERERMSVMLLLLLFCFRDCFSCFFCYIFFFSV